MRTLLIECVERTSLLAAVIALVLYLMRIKTAPARHAVWAGVVLVMLMLPAFLLWGPRASLPILPREIRQTPVTILLIVSSPVTAPVQVRTGTAARRPFVWNWSKLFVCGYVLGLCTLLLRLAIGTARVHRLLHGAVGRDGRLTHASCSTPITVGWVRPTVILPADWTEWPQARLDAILVHEREHARRRDPLFQWIALLNRALFWFHPLAWWLERRLSGLAEEACDSAVLAQGHDPRDYSEYLLDLARSVERAGTRIDALGMAMPGSFLPQRIRRMMTGAPAPRISRPRMACTAALCAAGAAILTVGTMVHAQSGKGPVFEVVSVRPSAPNEGGGRSGGKRGGGLAPQFDHGRFSYTSTLYGFIVRAYGMHGCGQDDCALLSGGPDWIKKDRFDIQAKSPDGTPDYTQTQFMESQAPRLQLMLQALLGDRFNLKLHREEKQLPVYLLTIGKNGPKLKPASAETHPVVEGRPMQDGILFMPVRHPNGEIGNTVQMTMKNRSIQELADTLSYVPRVLDRPLLDRTGLQGKFDVTMEFEVDSDAPLASLFAAFQEQLGLKVEAAKAPVGVLVIDHAERPSKN